MYLLYFIPPHKLPNWTKADAPITTRKYALEPVNLGICIPHMTRRSCRLTPGPGRFDCITQKCYPLVPAMMMTCHESRVFALQHYTQQTISWDWNDWGGSLPQYPNTIRYYLDNETAKFIAEGILQGTETSTIVQYYRRPSKFLFWHEPLDFLLDNFFDKTYYQEYLISCCFGIVDGRQHL